MKTPRLPASMCVLRDSTQAERSARQRVSCMTSKVAASYEGGWSVRCDSTRNRGTLNGIFFCMTKLRSGDVTAAVRAAFMGLDPPSTCYHIVAGGDARVFVNARYY